MSGTCQINFSGAKMAEENTEITTEDIGAPVDKVMKYSEDDVAKLIEQETSGLKKKVDELLTEKKTVSQKAKEAEEQARREAEERARQENDYKSLFESSQKKAKEFEEKWNSLNNQILTEKVESRALDIASDLADGNNAKILSRFIKERITVNGNDIIVKDEKGNPTVSTIDDLKKEFISSGMYDSLLRQSKASGGGATNSQSGAAANKDLSTMSRAEKLQYFKNKREAS